MLTKQTIKKLNLNDWRILNLFYRSPGWRRDSYTLDEIRLDRKITKLQARHSLRKLQTLQLIKVLNSALNFYLPIDNEILREDIISYYNNYF